MPRVTYAPVTGKTVGQTVGASKPKPTVATMKPSVSNPVGSMPYQPPGPVKTTPPTPSPGTGFQGGPARIPPTPAPPVNSGTSGVSGNFNPSAPNPPSPGTGFQGGPVGGNNPPPSQGVGFQGGPAYVPPPWKGDTVPPVRPPGGISVGDNVPPSFGGGWLDPHTPIPNIGGKSGFVPPNEVVAPKNPGGGIISNPGVGTPPPVVTPPTNPIPEPVIPPTTPPNTNPYGTVGQGVTPYTGAPPTSMPPISEPTLPVGYNPGGGVGGIATQPVSNPANNPAPFPETPIQSNADRSELAPPVGSWTKFTDKGKWFGQDAQAQKIANKRKANKDTNDATPDTGTIVTPTVKKKKTGGATSAPKSEMGGAPTEAGNTKAGKGVGRLPPPQASPPKKNKNAKANKNAKVTKADKQKAKNRTPQPGTPARPYRNRGVSYKPLGYGGTLRI